MNDAFSKILGQPKVRDFLRSSVVSERCTHAYLFVGPSGSNKTEAAFALAKALLCPKGASGPRGGECGHCENCRRIIRNTHPDVHFYEPGGASGYLVEQIREIISDTALAPIQSDKKIYILDRVDRMGTSCANALLKTLEEPPEDVVLILLARTRDSVLPTIASRCQIVPFRHIPPSEARGIISQNTGASDLQAKYALEATNGSITKAIGYLKGGNNRLELRNKLLREMGKIHEMDEWQLLVLAKQIVKDADGPLDDFHIKMISDIAASGANASPNQDLAPEELEKFFGKSQLKRIEQQNKRKLAQQTTERMKESLSIMSSWVRDVAMVASGATELIINEDFAADIEFASQLTNLADLSYVLRAIDEARAALDYNVSPETCFDAVLLKIRGAFNDARCTN